MGDLGGGFGGLGGPPKAKKMKNVFKCVPSLRFCGFSDREGVTGESAESNWESRSGGKPCTAACLANIMTCLNILRAEFGILGGCCLLAIHVDRGKFLICSSET